MSLDVGELGRVLKVHVVDAVPQTPARLIELARGLYGIGLGDEADAAARRAIDVAESRQPMLSLRVQLALDGKATRVLLPAARALLAEADAVEAYALAARALGAAGAHAEADAAVEAGAKRFTEDGELLLVGAELRLANSDPAGARAMLSRASSGRSRCRSDNAPKSCWVTSPSAAVTLIRRSWRVPAHG